MKIEVDKEYLEKLERDNRQLKFAVEGSDESWKMRQENLSPHYTTRWSDILVVDLRK